MLLATDEEIVTPEQIETLDRLFDPWAEAPIRTEYQKSDEIFEEDE